MMVWAAISWYSAVPLITLHGRITASDCMHNLGNQMLPVARMFPNIDAVFQDGNSPYSHTEVFSPGSTSMKMHFNIPGQHNRQT